MKLRILVPEMLGLARGNDEVAKCPGVIVWNLQILEKL